MNHMPRLRRTVLVLVVLFAGWLACGPLFAWAPVTPGFSTVHTDHTVVVFRDPPGLTVPAARIEAAIERLQAEIGLPFRSRVRFLLCDNWSDFVRFTPWLRVTPGIGAITLPIGLMTYVTPTVRTRADLVDFMTHEASHSLLYQHASVRHRLEMGRQAWFVEGIGVHFGNPATYAPWPEFRNMRSAADIVAAIAPPAGENRRAAGDSRFRYSAYGYFIGYLNNRFGSDAFRRFAAVYVEHPPTYRDDFQRTFGVSFEDAARAFGESISKPQ